MSSHEVGSDQILIPKLIHVSWPTRDIINSNSVIIKNGLHNLVNLNPDWSLTIYNDEEVDNYLRSQLDLAAYKLYQNSHIVEKLDIWRLLKLYNEGGLYIDLDRLYNIPLKNIINSNTVCVLPTCKDYDFTQDFMLSAPSNPIHLETINLILERKRLGHSNIYFLGAQTYMHAITKVLTGNIIDTNPGKEVFDEIRKIIDGIPFIETYREDGPFKTVVFRDNTLKIDHELEKRKLYSEFNIKHWTNQW